MKKDGCKPVFYNSYKCDETVVRVNEYSTISSELVTQMISVDFPAFYNCIRVELYSDSEHIETFLEEFVSFCEPKFTVVLIQRVGFDSALLSVFSPNSILFMHDQLFHFEFTNCSSVSKIIY